MKNMVFRLVPLNLTRICILRYLPSMLVLVKWPIIICILCLPMYRPCWLLVLSLAIAQLDTKFLLHMENLSMWVCNLVRLDSSHYPPFEHCKFSIPFEAFVSFSLFSGRKLVLSDFDRHHKPSKYFPVGEDPKVAEFGQDQYHSAGLHCSNLALVTRLV